MVAAAERELRTLNRELLQLDQQIRALLKRQTELHERKTHLEAGWEHQRVQGKRRCPGLGNFEAVSWGSE
ncbi:hypothetical protein MHYP_G00260740 [Metynnis hypsauchen]